MLKATYDVFIVVMCVCYFISPTSVCLLCTDCVVASLWFVCTRDVKKKSHAVSASKVVCLHFVISASGTLVFVSSAPTVAVKCTF